MSAHAKQSTIGITFSLLHTKRHFSALVPFDCLHETNTTHTASGEWQIADPAKSSQTTIVLKAR
jgi:hypothetical protein